jgi:hypothetical protein
MALLEEEEVVLMPVLEPELKEEERGIILKWLYLYLLPLILSSLWLVSELFDLLLDRSTCHCLYHSRSNPVSIITHEIEGR